MRRAGASTSRAFDSRSSILGSFMSEQVWYYARGETEKGPVTGAQIKALAAAGKIRQDDFVWKEGMDSWTSAGDLKELFPAERPDDTPREFEPVGPIRMAPRAKQPAATTASDPLVRPIGHTSLIVGLLTALLARGCDTLAGRQVDRLRAIASAGEKNFQDQWQRRRAPLEQQQLTLQAEVNPSANDQRQLGELNNQLVQLDQSMKDTQRQLEAGMWLQQRSAVRQAENDHLTWGFWREATFLLGTVILTVGLLAVGFSGEGPERWICLGMIGAIVFSIYVGGGAFTP